MLKKIVFNLGSNMGDKKDNLDKASLQIIDNFDLKKVKISKIYESRAMLQKNAPKEWDINFYNISLLGQINIKKYNALKILTKIKQIEKNIGRQDRGRWSPREIDIDILLLGNLKVKIDNILEIPHYDIKNRDFFTKTMEEILPNWQEFL